VVAGLLLTLAAMRIVSNQLFGISTYDPITIAVVIAAGGGSRSGRPATGLPAARRSWIRWWPSVTNNTAASRSLAGNSKVNLPLAQILSSAAYTGSRLFFGRLEFPEKTDITAGVKYKVMSCEKHQPANNAHTQGPAHLTSRALVPAAIGIAPNNAAMVVIMMGRKTRDTALKNCFPSGKSPAGARRPKRNLFA